MQTRIGYILETGVTTEITVAWNRQQSHTEIHLLNKNQPSAKYYVTVFFQSLIIYSILTFPTSGVALGTQSKQTLFA